MKESTDKVMKATGQVRDMGLALSAALKEFENDFSSQAKLAEALDAKTSKLAEVTKQYEETHARLVEDEAKLAQIEARITHLKTLL